MKMKSKRLVEHLEESIKHLDVSGFELLELLDIRSQLAAREPIMDDEEKARLEKFDQQLARHASYCAGRISEVADMSAMRKGAHVLPSHWWWYLDEFSFGNQGTMAG
ncbi:MAG: hypothetical protein R6U55_00170 [Desulfovermiculus sp.]